MEHIIDLTGYCIAAGTLLAVIVYFLKSKGKNKKKK